MDAVSPASPRFAGWRRWHRRIAWVALIAALTFALTGLLHPLMTRFQPKPVQFKPPALALQDVVLPAPATALAAAGIDEMAGLRPVFDGSRWLWRVETATGVARYLDLEGAVLVDGERAHAERLARWYSGETSAAVAETSFVNGFDANYSYVNRLLPVWRLRFARDDGLTLYVSTVDDRLATISDTRKQLFQQSFVALHTWGWLPAPLRNGWINALLAAVAFTVLAGLVLVARAPAPRRFTLRRAHRWGGALVSLAVLAWAASGFIQARGNAERERADAPQRPLRVAAAALAAPLSLPAAASTVALVQLAGAPAWRLGLQAPLTTTGRGFALGEHQHHDKPPQGVAATAAVRYVSAVDGKPLPGGEAVHLAELAQHFGLPVASAAATPVGKFTPDYGFLYKRLPVWRLDADDAAHTAYFIDTASERLAARVDDGDRWRGALFATAHKWEWVTPLAGKDWRDGLSAVFAALLIGVALGGTWLRRRR